MHAVYGGCEALAVAWVVRVAEKLYNTCVKLGYIGENNSYGASVSDIVLAFREMSLGASVTLDRLGTACLIGVMFCLCFEGKGERLLLGWPARVCQ